MSSFDLVQTGSSEIHSKLQTINFLDENDNFDRFLPFQAIFGLLWPPYQFSKLSMNIFDLVPTGLSEIGKKILNNIDM